MLGNIVNLMSKYKNISCSYSIFNVVKLSFYELDLFSIASLTITENLFFFKACINSSYLWKSRWHERKYFLVLIPKIYMLFSMI